MSSGAEDFLGGATPVDVPDVPNDPGELPADAVTADDVIDAYPEPKIVCRSVQIYGPPEATPVGRRARLVVSEDLDPRYVKLTITEPEPKANGYRSASIRVDAIGYAGLADAFSPYGTNTRIPTPTGVARADSVRRVADDVRRAARAIAGAAQPGEAFEDTVTRLRSVAYAANPYNPKATAQPPADWPRKPTIDAPPADVVAADLRTLRPRGYEGDGGNGEEGSF